MKSHRIALYPGDGIGSEVTDAAVAVLQAATKAVGGFRLEFVRFDWGVAYHEQNGAVVPPDFLAQLRPFDAIFLGAVGQRDLLGIGERDVRKGARACESGSEKDDSGTGKGMKSI